jgi:hypothetical protein
MNKKTLFAIAALAALFVLGCASQQGTAPLIERTAPASGTAEKTASNQKTLDWANRALGEQASPPWLLPAIRKNYSVVKQEWQAGTDKMMRVGISRGQKLNAAQTIADVQFSASLARELKQTTIAKIGNTLQSSDEFSVMNDAAVKAHVTFSGWERVIDHWVLTETIGNDGKKTAVYDYYVLYACDPGVWSQMVAKYLVEVTGNLQDKKAQQTIASLFAEIDAETKREQAKSDIEFAAEIRAQQQAIQKPLSQAEQFAAYRSGDPAKIAAASVTKDDTDYIAALAALAGIGD